MSGNIHKFQNVDKSLSGKVTDYAKNKKKGKSVFSKLGNAIVKALLFVLDSIKWIYRKLKIIVHRYLILFFVAFIISHKYLFNDPVNLNVFYLHCALVILAFIAFFLGHRSPFQSLSICAGFIFSMMCHGTDDILHCFLNTLDGNFFNTYSVEKWILISIGVLPFLLKFFTYLISEKPSKKMFLDLYPERERIYLAVLQYLSNHNALAIDSPYGNGKSTMVEILKNENKDWNFITIGILSTTVENVEFCIVREINQVLETKGVFLNPISKIKSFFSHDFTFCIGDFLFEDQSYEEQIKEFVSGIQRLKQVIVLNFEDIDRITDKEHLNKIFSICDTLTKYELKYQKQYIKIIYQCNKHALEKLYEKDYGSRYVEKFIQKSFSIDPLTGDFFKSVWEKNEKKYGEIEDNAFDFLSQSFRQDLFQQNLSLRLNGHTVRSIEKILDEVNFAYRTICCGMIDSVEDLSIVFETIVIFYITKYFFPDVYDALEKGKAMDQQILFYAYFDDGHEENLSLVEFRRRVRSSQGTQGLLLNRFFDKDQNDKAEKNYNALLFLTFLGYDDEYYKKIGGVAYTASVGDALNMNKAKFLHKVIRKKENVLQELLMLHS